MTDIEYQVMRRVRRIALLRIIISGGLFALALALIALYGIGREVWVARVLQNGPQNFFGRASYLLYAFLHTRFVVQGLIVVALASIAYFIRETVRYFSEGFLPRTA